MQDFFVIQKDLDRAYNNELDRISLTNSCPKTMTGGSGINIDKEIRRNIMKKNLQSDLRMWLKHWYLGGGSDENRGILATESLAKEKVAYKMIRELLGNDAAIDQNASPLSVKVKDDPGMRCSVCGKPNYRKKANKIEVTKSGVYMTYRVTGPALYFCMGCAKLISEGYLRVAAWGGKK